MSQDGGDESAPAQDEVEPRLRRWEERLGVPVLVAAVVSLPAVWLTLLEQPWSDVGLVVNALSGAVLLGETAVLLLVSRDKRRWVHENRWLLGISLLTLVAVVFTIGPLQLLRLVRAIGALRVLRAGRIVSATRRLRRRWGLTGPWSRILTAVASLVVAAFVAVVLADPTSRSRQLLEGLVGEVPATVLVVVAGLLLGGATFVVLRHQRSD